MYRIAIEFFLDLPWWIEGRNFDSWMALFNSLYFVDAP